MKNVIRLLGILFVAGSFVIAKPMPPFPITHNQTDGTTVLVQQHGDEHLSYAESMDGFLLLPDSHGDLYFADKDGLLSSYMAKNISSRTAEDLAFLAALPKNEILTTFLANAPRKSFGEPTASILNTGILRKPSISSITKGAKNIAVILVNSSNVTFVNTQAAYSAQLNQVNYSLNGHLGSVRDYYIAQSKGVFTPNFVVFGPVTLTGTFASYQDDALIKEAMGALDASVDFSQFDNDGDGEIDGVAIVTAGKQADNGGHGIYQGYLGGAFSKDGKKVNKFLMTPELSDNSSTKLDGMGSFAHEFGHMLGLMDLYQTNGSTSVTPGF